MQKTILLDIDANICATIDAKIALGWVIHQTVSLQPTLNKLLVVYYDPTVVE